MSKPVLYDYWRSSASYRVRIALNLLGIEYEHVAVNLLPGEQRQAAHVSRNPQGLVPVLDIDGIRLTQSLAIIEYLDETRKAGFLPADPDARARIRATAYAMAMDIHPVANLSVLSAVEQMTGRPEAKKEWVQRVLRRGLSALETMLSDTTGPFCFGDAPSMADMTLIPQLYNAARWEVDMTQLNRCREVAENCAVLPAFAAAHPDSVKPADT
ncbi:maleylacetoacetate isomerase [Devosia sp. A369]